MITISKFKIYRVIFVLLYLGIGTAYSQRTSYCEEQRLATNSTLKSIDPEITGSNLIGRAIITVLWPAFILENGINKAGIFNCKK